MIYRGTAIGVRALRPHACRNTPIFARRATRKFALRARSSQEIELRVAAALGENLGAPTLRSLKADAGGRADLTARPKDVRANAKCVVLQHLSLPALLALAPSTARAADLPSPQSPPRHAPTSAGVASGFYAGAFIGGAFGGLTTHPYGGGGGSMSPGYNTGVLVG